jgi:hypothetical protein
MQTDGLITFDPGYLQDRVISAPDQPDDPSVCHQQGPEDKGLERTVIGVLVAEISFGAGLVAHPFSRAPAQQSGCETREERLIFWKRAWKRAGADRGCGDCAGSMDQETSDEKSDEKAFFSP